MFLHSCWFPVGPAAFREPFTDADSQRDAPTGRAMFPNANFHHYYLCCCRTCWYYWSCSVSRLTHTHTHSPAMHNGSGKLPIWRKSKRSVFGDECACVTSQLFALLRLINKYSSLGLQMEICSGFTTHIPSRFSQSFFTICMKAFENNTAC